jgi:hypothetical protein
MVAAGAPLYGLNGNDSPNGGSEYGGGGGGSRGRHGQALYMKVGGSMQGTGTINLSGGNGGNGGRGQYSGGGGGAGGSGGTLIIRCHQGVPVLNIDVRGGTGGAAGVSWDQTDPAFPGEDGDPGPPPSLETY